LQAAAILLEKSQTRTINLAVNQQANQAFMTQHRREGKLALGHIKRCRHVAERLAVNAGHVFVRRVAHGGVIAVEIQGAHRGA